jgi:hypothetical protein
MTGLSMRVEARSAQTANVSKVPKGKADNVYADQSGNVARRTDQRWETREGDQWKSDRGTSGAARASRGEPAQRPQTTSPSTSDRQRLERDYQARQRSAPRGGGRRR